MDDLTYILPLTAERPLSDEMLEYLASTAQILPVLVVDGSRADVYAQTGSRLPPAVTHVPPDPDVRCANGKVRGVLTGLSRATTDLVVIADDDVRYTETGLRRLRAELEDADLVAPQNYFAPLPWHARWDTGRTLINRVTGGDFPGTLGLRTSVLRGGGYDGDVLFENLELMRTVVARGGRVRRVPDLYVGRLPPTTRHFVGQRVRQAYDEFARPARLGTWLAVLPALATLAWRRPRLLPPAAAAVVLLAELGRRRAGGRAHFHWTCSLLAPAWVLERAVTVWLALVMRARGGVPYAGARLVRAANPTSTIRRRTLASAT